MSFVLIFTYFLLLTNTINARELRQRYLFDKEIIQEMDAWELKQLKDFVRKRGRGSISKEPFEQEMIQLVAPSEDSPELDLMDLSESMGPMLRPSSIIAPSSYFSSKKPERKSILMTTTTPTIEITQMGMPKRTGRHRALKETSKEGKESSTRSSLRHLASITTTAKPPSDELSQEDFKTLVNLIQHIHARRKAQSGEEKTSSEDQSTSSMGKWEVMEEETTTLARTAATTHGLTKDERESYVRQISEQISMILMMNKKGGTKRPTHQQLPPRPKVTIIRNGSAEQTNDGRYEFVATVSLIQDDGKNILVDTGMGTDINGRTVLLNKLSSIGIAPPNVQIVISTHGHPDHNGGVHDFPDAVHYQGWYQHQNTRFNLSGLFEGDRHQLTENVYLIKSPGHSSDDIAVVVKEEETLGSVVISGDTFLRKEDIDYQMMWKPLSANEMQQMESRRRLACGPWRWIVPGHGPPFPLDPSVRAKFGC